MIERELSAKVTRLERALADMPGVRGARVEANGTDIRSVRVLVVPERHKPATIERVRSLASGSLGVEVSPQRIHLLSAPGEGDDRDLGVAHRQELDRFELDGKLE